MKFTASDLEGHKVNIVLSDVLAWKGQVFDVETGEPIHNLRGLDIHVDLKENAAKITATLLLVDSDSLGSYDDPTRLNVPVQTIEALADIELKAGEK